MVGPEQVAAYRDAGFVIIRQMFSAAEMEPILRACRESNLLKESTSSNKDFDGNPSFHAAFWRDPGGDTLLAKLPLMERIVDGAEKLVGSEIYYWRSRLVFKRPHEKGRIEYHQDYSYWYHDGCVFPDLVSCSIAVTPSTRANGCLEILKGSHLAGRLDLQSHTEGAEYPDPRYVEKYRERFGTVYCELESGDALYFHCNAMHGSAGNSTDAPRILIHNSYNAAHNEPIPLEGQAEVLVNAQRYERLKRHPDDLITAHRYTTVFQKETFFPTETTEDNDVGIFKRSRRKGSGKAA